MRFNYLLLFSFIILSCSCASKQQASEGPATAKTVDVTTARSVVKQVSAAFDETGTFVAEESSDIAPPVAGRVLRTPVDVGAFVKQGQVICELDHRDADLKLQQMRAQLPRRRRLCGRPESELVLIPALSTQQRCLKWQRLARL